MTSPSARSTTSILRQSIAAILCAATAFSAMQAHAQDAADSESSESDSGDVSQLSDISVTDDPLRMLSSEPSASSFGFSKPLIETPRTVNFVSEEQIRTLNISQADDLVRVVPGVYTNRRWGLQGGVDVRGVSADMYFRGMKRLQMQGHARTSLTGMDAIEIVKGPPSPIYGMGRIGGYMNMVPKSGRAKTGSYMPESSGFAQMITGSWDKAELSFGVGGPMPLGDKQGGYYVYGLVEDSPQTWVQEVPAKQKLLQAATSVDNFIGPFRLETGGQYQNSRTAGAFMHRVTQDLIDNGTYIRGTPLVNLDSNGDGQIGYLETHLNSPVNGVTTATNQPLNQRFRWPTAGGAPIDYNGGFPTIPGIPQTMLDYLNSPEGLAAANCEAADIMRSMPAGGPTPISGALPVGFVLNPCTVGTTKVNPRRSVYEREQDAQLTLLFFDLVYDTNPDFTVKNQLFYDRLESYKDSNLPYGERQSLWRIEDKITVTKKISDDVLPSWMHVNSLASLNYRVTSAYQGSGGGDYDYRNDIMAGDGTLIPNASFWNQLEDNSVATGAPKTTKQKSKYTETGVGAMLDINFDSKTNLILGARYDWARAHAQDSYRFSQTCANAQSTELTCTSAGAAAVGFVGEYLPFRKAKGKDQGESWSVSLSQQMPLGLRPYVTIANSSIVLDGANNLLTYATVNSPGGFIGDAELKEVGIKGSWLGGKLQGAIAGYEQTRTDLSNNPDDPTADADVTSTENRGIEVELKWVPTPNLFFQIFGLVQEIEYIFASSANIELTGRQLGFQDVLDANGNVIYPAEAFVYGGRLQVTLPPELRSKYLTKNGNPEKQAGVNANWQITKKFSANVGANWFSKIPVTRINTIELPDVTILNAGVAWQSGNWFVQGSVSNITDEQYYRPRNGDTVAGLMSSMPGRGWLLTVRHDFR